MKDQFAPLPWYLQPGSWPYWPTPPLTGASMPHGGPPPQGSPSMAASLSGGLFGNLAQPAGGILDNFAQRVGGNLGSPSSVIADPRADQWTSVASPIESNTTTVPNSPPPQGRLTPLLTQAQFQLRDQNEPVPVARKKINEADPWHNTNSTPFTATWSACLNATRRQWSVCLLALLAGQYRHSTTKAP
jgi:hypothetical protein